MRKILIKFQAFVLAFAILTGSTIISANADSHVMTYSFGGTPKIYANYVEKIGNVLDVISPSVFDANTDGTVTIHSITSEFVSLMHSKGISVTPFFSNHWNKTAGNAALDNIEAVTNTLAKAVKDYSLDGINVDIQNVNETYRSKYTAFVKTLREKLPSSTITVAVAANPNGWTAGWHGSYDYTGLAQYSDYLMIMAYDESYYGSEPGPVASANFVTKTIKYALDRVPADKLVLGVPLFGRYWKSGASVGGYGITMADVDSIISMYPNASVTYDETAQSVKVVVNLTSEFKLWGGNTLSTGTYTIWYDNLRALEYKISLINSHGLKGIGSWSLGQESEGFWELCSKALKNLIFSDITGHWAEQYITFCNEQNWLIGSNGKFLPDKPMTRAEAAAVLVRIAGLEGDAPGEDFDDTANHWARKYIAIARKHGLVSGVGGSKYEPNERLSREQLAVMLDRVVVFSNAIDFYDNPFTDLSRESNPWSYDSIIKMYANGVITGYPDKTFRPQERITRAEVAAMLERISGYGIKLGKNPETRNFSHFSADGYNERAQSPR